MPRFIPNERLAACSAFCRPDIAGPTSHAAANSSAVLARVTAIYSSSVVGGIFRGGELHDLAFGDHCGGSGKNLQGFEAADLNHHFESLAEEKIADQDARLVAPKQPRREPAAPQLALVDHVVVEQRCRVHE